MRSHKFGFHVNGISPAVREAIFRIRPDVIKTLHHDANFWKEVRQSLPNALLIGRLFEPNQNFQDDPQRRGREFAEKVLREEVNRVEREGRPLYDAWESFNEVMPESAPADLQRKFDEFQVGFAEKLRSEGFEPIAMNFGTGNFLGHQFLDNFRGTLETHKYLGFHEYDWPTMDRLHKIGLQDENGGMWLCLRYRRTMEEVRREFPDSHTVIITECGMTQGVQGRDDVGPWHASHPIAVDDYWQSLLWYNSELMKDDYVSGACLFVVGAISPWESFEHLGPIMDRVADFQAQIGHPADETARAGAGGRETSATEIPAGGEEADEGSPVARVSSSARTEPSPASPVGETENRVRDEVTAGQKPAQEEDRAATPDTISLMVSRELADYHSHYVLYPENTDWWWYEAGREYFRRFGSTRGEKVRDAAFLHGSQGHTITCINPSQATLVRLQELNPEATLDVITARDPGELAAKLRNRVVNNAPFG
jgi:hypothetical protein